jgi:hypothetical protein
MTRAATEGLGLAPRVVEKDESALPSAYGGLRHPDAGHRAPYAVGRLRSPPYEKAQS